MRRAALGMLFGWSVAACTGYSNKRMHVGKPIKVDQGVCLVNTSYEQDGELLNWDDATRKLSRFEASAPYMKSGNSWAIGSIVAAVAATPAVVVGSYGKRGDIDMDEDVANGLLIGGIVVGVGGLVMCIVSDAEYAAGGEAYNKYLKARGLGDSEDRANDDRAYEDAESLK